LVLQLMGGMMLSPQRTFFPVYLRDLGYSAILIATLATVRQLMGLVASLVGGTLSDVVGRKWTLLAGQVGFLLGGLVFLTPSDTTPSVAWIAALWSLSGFGGGLHTLGGQSYLIDAAPADRLGLSSALFNWGYTVGGALGSPIAGYLLDTWNYGVFGAALAAFALATIAINALALPRLPTHGRRKADSWSTLFGYREIAVRPAVVTLTLLRFLPTVFWGMATVLLPLLLSSAGATYTSLALYATGSQIVAAVAQIITGRAADRWEAYRPTLVVFVALLAGILGIAAMPRAVPGLVVFGTLSTAAAWSLSTLLPLWVARVTPRQERGRVLGWIHLWWNGAMMAGAMVGGTLVERQPSLPFALAAALNVGAIVLTVAFFRAESWKIPQPAS
jgi:MFS family permease